MNRDELVLKDIHRNIKETSNPISVTDIQKIKGIKWRNIPGLTVFQSQIVYNLLSASFVFGATVTFILWVVLDFFWIYAIIAGIFITAMGFRFAKKAMDYYRSENGKSNPSN